MQNTNANKKRLLAEMLDLSRMIENERLWLLAKFPTDGADMADAIREEADDIPGAMGLADEFESEQ